MGVSSAVYRFSFIVLSRGSGCASRQRRVADAQGTFPNACAYDACHALLAAISRNTIPRMGFPSVSWLLAASIAAAGVSAPTAAAAPSRTLSLADAMSALRAVGATKTFTAPSAKWGPLILVTGGSPYAEQLIVHVFPSVRVGRVFNKDYPPPSTALVQAIRTALPGSIRGPYKFLPRVFACNVTVASGQLPWFRSAHPSTAQRRQLGALLSKIRATQNRVVDYLRRRCGG